MSLQRFSQITPFVREGEDKFFIKFFLLDDSLNLNRWQVTSEALHNNLKTFIGTPFVVERKFDHPRPENQESARDGTITEVGFDESSGKAYGVAEIFDPEAKQKISSGEVSFVSPSISVEDHDMINVGGKDVAIRFKGEHVAGVKEPAFGKVKAQIKGQCHGSEGTCQTQLRRVQASVDILEANRDKIKLFNIEALKQYFISSPCTESCLQKKKDEGMEINDQAIAICLQECGDAKEGQTGNTMYDLISTNSSNKTITNTSKVMSSQMNQTISSTNPKAVECGEGQKEEFGKCVDAQLKDVTAKLDAVSKENTELKARLDAEQKKPYVERIITAKISLGKIKEEERKAETENQSKKDVETLTDLAKEYESVVTAKSEMTPTIKYKFASVSKAGDLDAIVTNYKRLTN